VQILHRKHLKEGVLAKWLFQTLGNRKGKYVVIDQNETIYYIGTHEECKNYIKEDKIFFRYRKKHD
jgi:hypothetical protein